VQNNIFRGFRQYHWIICMCSKRAISSNSQTSKHHRTIWQRKPFRCRSFD